MKSSTIKFVSRLATGRGRKLPPVVFPWRRRAAVALAFSLAAGTLTPSRQAHALPVPDSTALARLQEEALGKNRFRIVTTDAQYFAEALSADAEGVTLVPSKGRPALILGPGARPVPARRAPWSSIEQVDGMRSHGLKNAIEGAIVGGLIGAGLTAAIQPRLHDAEAAAVILIPIGGVLGAGIGALTGSATGWQPLLP